MTFLMTWNRQDKGGFRDYDGVIAATTGVDARPVVERWSTGNRRRVDLDERVYLLRHGTEHPGVVASGIVLTEAEEGPHWDAEQADKTAWYCDVSWDRVVAPENALPLETLRERIPTDYRWTPRGGGVGLDDHQAEILAQLWAQTLSADDLRRRDAEAAEGPAAETIQSATQLLRRLLGVALPGRSGPASYQVQAVSPPSVLVKVASSGEPRRLDITIIDDALGQLRGDGFDAGGQGWVSGFTAAVLRTLPGVREYAEPPLLWLGQLADSAERVDGRAVVPFDGELTRPSAGTSRGEQSALRNVLLGGRAHHRCALCGQEYPVELLRAAHIKRRSLCTEDEKRDLAHVAMPACLFGCDSLFELGFLAVDAEGTVVSATKRMGGAISSYLADIDGRACRAYGARSAKYFAWHYSNVYRR